MCHFRLSARQKFFTAGFGGVDKAETIGFDLVRYLPRCRYRLRQGSKRLDPDYLRLLGIPIGRPGQRAFSIDTKTRHGRNVDSIGCASRPHRPHGVCNNSKRSRVCLSGALLTFSDGKLKNGRNRRA